MYIHIGGDAVIRAADIIGIFDLDNASWSHRTRAFLTEAEKAGRVEAIGDELPRSFIVSDAGGLPRIILTHVTTATLKRRMAQLP
jgi:hypothetical protein